MILHVVLYRPKNGLSHEDARRFADALVAARAAAPWIRHFWVGRRLAAGPTYRLGGFPEFPYAAVAVFDDATGLLEYLRHPAHQALSRRFNEAADAASVYDFEVGEAADALGLLSTIEASSGNLRAGGPGGFAESPEG